MPISYLCCAPGSPLAYQLCPPSQSIEPCKIYGRSASSAQRTRQSPSPELPYRLRATSNDFDRSKQSILMGLLHPGFQKIGGLKEDGRENTGA